MRTWKQCYSAWKYISGCYHFLIHLYMSIHSFNMFAFSIFFHFTQTLLYSSYFLSYVIVDVCLPVCMTWKVLYGPFEIYHKTIHIQSSGPLSYLSKQSFSALHFALLSLTENTKLLSLCKHICRRQEHAYMKHNLLNWNKKEASPFSLSKWLFLWTMK
jgi:hypothetical protein